MNMKIYETSDFHLAITLCTMGFKLTFVNKADSKRYVFEFEDSPEIQPLIEQYFRGELRLDPRLVLINAKLLKDRMFEKI